MKRLLKHNKITSVILIFVILIQMPGCISTKIITSVSDIPASEEYLYILHGEKSKYQILNARISDGIITGNLRSGEPSHSGHKVHLYIPADSVVKFNSDMTMVLPVDKVSKIELQSVAKGTTALALGGIVVAILIIIGLVSFQNWNTNFSGI